MFKWFPTCGLRRHTRAQSLRRMNLTTRETNLPDFMIARLKRAWIVALAALGSSMLLPARAAGQDLGRAIATRAELQASLTQLEQYIASSGYSGRLRNEKRREAALIRARLENGDLQVGDQIDLSVAGEPTLTAVFPVVTGRVLSLPGLPEIPLTGVLRSEAKDYLTAQIGKYIREPQVRVRTLIRLSVFGSVHSPGFYQVPADALATDAFTLAGGIDASADPTKAFVRRSNEEIWPRDAFREAMQKGLTLDQLNLRAGDELIMDPGGRRNFNPYAIIGVLGAISTTYLLINRIF